MANTTVTDALFMANVTQVNTIENSKRLQAEGMTFAQAMGDANTQNLKTDSTNQDMQLQSGKRTTVETGRNPVDKKNESEGMSKVDKEEPKDGIKNAKDTLDKAKDIKDAIEEKLDVTDEDIEKAMEVLGISMQDLFNQDSLRNLMMELGGCEDSLELLTNADLYQGMQDVLLEAGEMRDSLISEMGISEEEFTQMLGDDNLFKQAMESLSTGEETFGPNMENAAFQAEVPGIAPGDGKVLRPEDTLKDDDNHRVNVEVVKEPEGNNTSDQSKTETFRNITQSEKTQSNNDENMAGMTQTTTSVTVNELGEVVETVERFSSAFSDANEIVSQVTETIKLSVSTDTTSMEMMLHPASLGTVNMQISSQNGVVTAHLLVQNEEVKAALESQLVTLKETFEEQGKTVEAVEVSVANYDLDRGMQQQARDEQEKENALRAGRNARRRLRLDDISDEEITELEDEERIAADMMRREGNSLDFMA